ncbi:MAG: VOC family protein [Actinobacteria bacterium]|nr:VOC family protein [Actinomycetota bacterium]
MPLPETDHRLPFTITRASHVELTVEDVEESIRFYRDVIGLVVTAREGDVAYLRGLEEAAHHSLVLRQADRARECAGLGFRVFDDDHLDALAGTLRRLGGEVQWVEPDHQGRTLRCRDPAGVPLEFCARMEVEPRHITSFRLFRGGAGQRLDHFQLLTPSVRKTCEFYVALGFRISEYLVDGSEEMIAVFLQRKGNPHDLVLFQGDGPRLHHVAYTTIDAQTLLRACDAAGEAGFGPMVERGPGRHGPGHAQYVYMRDPDGHRVELFTTHYQMIDIELEPSRWTVDDPAFSTPWGLPAQRSWHEEASRFVATDVTMLPSRPTLPTLERYLAERAQDARREESKTSARGPRTSPAPPGSPASRG